MLHDSICDNKNMIRSEGGMSYNVYDKMVELAEKARVETAGSPNPLFTHYQNDLFEIDKEVMEYDSQYGDQYVWAIKDNGCGTYLLRAGLKESAITIGTIPEKSRFFHIKTDGPNSGKIKQIDKTQAIELLMTVKEMPGRVPRRTHLYTHLENIIFPGDKAGHSVSRSKLTSEFTPRPGDKTAIKVTASSGSHITAVEVVRTKVAPNTDNDYRTIKKHEHYCYPQSIGARVAYHAAPKYFLLETTQQGFAKIEEISEKVFKSALRKVEKEVVKDAEKERALSF